MPSTSLHTPVALFIFNRPELTQLVFEAISQAQPKTLLLVADGPRSDRPGEVQQCMATRAIVDNVNWDCEVLTNYSDTNLGCKQRVSSGLDWVFSKVEEAIILEDDCLPAPSFFQFCQTLLAHYRDDERIMSIGGHNYQMGHTRTAYSYYFSRYSHIWGWASWRRAWQHYDVSQQTWPEFKALQLLKIICEDPYEQQYWSEIFDRVRANQIDTWDYQWTYACWSQGGLSIVPEKNLVSNLGFGSNATHTTGNSPWANQPVTDIWDIHHPPFILRHQIGDQYTFDHLFGGLDIKRNNTLPVKLRHKLAHLKQKATFWSKPTPVLGNAHLPDNSLLL